MRITLNCAAGTFGWLCGGGTFALVPNVPVAVRTSPIKVALFRIRKGRVVRHCVKFYDLVLKNDDTTANRVRQSGCQLVCVGGTLADVTKSFVSRAHKLVDKTVFEFAKFHRSLSRKYSIRKSGNDYGYMHRYMTEQDLPRGMPVSVTCGQPLLHDGLREWSDAAVYATFVSCLEAAKRVIEFDPTKVTNQANVYEALYTSALRMFGGVYHIEHETEDDRTLPATKLYTNHDCDDMALACSSLALRLARLLILPSYGLRKYDAADVIMHVRPVGALTLQGRTFLGGGHNWAVLQMPNNRILHLECTQLFAPHVGRLDELYGRGVFLQRDRNNMNVDIKGIKALQTDMYKIVCAAYSHNAMYIPTTASTMCVDYSTFMSGEAELHQVPLQGLPDPAIAALRATPGPAEIAKVVERVHGAYKVVYGNCQPQPCTNYKHDGYHLVTEASTRCYAISPANAVAFS